MQLLNDFLRHVRSDQENLSGMFDKGSLDDIVNTAHRMKGSSRMVGANYLADACEKVEQAAKSGDMGGAVSGKAGLDEAISRIEFFIVKGISE
jgi:HPt (histidine-containing phosphotransfer) domain-containing protein